LDSNVTLPEKAYIFPAGTVAECRIFCGGNHCIEKCTFARKGI